MTNATMNETTPEISEDILKAIGISDPTSKKFVKRGCSNLVLSQSDGTGSIFCLLGGNSIYKIRKMGYTIAHHLYVMRIHPLTIYIVKSNSVVIIETGDFLFTDLFKSLNNEDIEKLREYMRTR